MNKYIAELKRKAGITEQSRNGKQIQEMMHVLATLVAEDARELGAGELDHHLRSLGDNLAQLIHKKLGI